MKITKMRLKGQVPSTDLILLIEKQLRLAFEKAGFITEVEAKTRSSMKVGMRMKCFTLDLNKHDQNLYISRSGDHLTSLPTWDQRVEFNNILNSLLDKYEISANVKSGPYTIRQGLTNMNEDDWHDQKPDWILSNEAKGYGPIEKVNVKEYKEQQRINRNRRAKEKREAFKLTREYQDRQFNKKANKIVNSEVSCGA